MNLKCVTLFIRQWAYSLQPMHEKKTISAAQDNYDTFAYADTDSLHLIGPTTPPESLWVDPVELGGLEA